MTLIKPAEVDGRNALGWAQAAAVLATTDISDDEVAPLQVAMAQAAAQISTALTHLDTLRYIQARDERDRVRVQQWRTDDIARIDVHRAEERAWGLEMADAGRQAQVAAAREIDAAREAARDAAIADLCAAATTVAEAKSDTAGDGS